MQVVSGSAAQPRKATPPPGCCLNVSSLPIGTWLTVTDWQPSDMLLPGVPLALMP